MMNYFDFSQHSKWKMSPQGIVLVLLALLSTGLSADIGKYFTKSPQSIVAPPGDRVTFQCESTPMPEKVRWKLNNRFLHPANQSDIRIISGNTLVVKLSKDKEKYNQQVGDYQCVVEFGAEALTSLPAQLTIASMEEFKRGENRSLTVVEGNSVAISCEAPYSNPPPVVQFYKDGRPIEPESGKSVVTESGVLLLSSVTMADAGHYYCAALNHITTETFLTNWATQLIVESRFNTGRTPPIFLVKPKPYSVVPKDGNITLECVAVGNPPPFTTWRKLRAPSSQQANLNTNKGSLHLFNFGIAEEGEYICEAHNGVGESLTTHSTLVLNSMPNITKEPKSLVVEEGGEASFDCGTEGLPSPRVYWLFNGNNVNDDGNIKTTGWGLKISNVEKKHAGLFQCFATNPMGTVTSPAELKVMPKQIMAMANDSTDLEDPMSSMSPPVTRHHNQGSHHHKSKFNRGKHKRRKHKGQDMIPPSKPIMNRISDDSVMVRWSVPPNSGYPIQFFKIQYKEVSKRNARWMTIDDDIPPHIHSYEVRDLRIGHAYRFRVVAVYSNNDNKEGPNSDKFVLQRDTTVRRPTFVPAITNASAYNTSSIQLRWKHMRGEVGGLEGFFIYYREATSAGEYSKVTVLGSESDHHYINHLKPGTSYDIKIQAFNAGGASNFSSIIAAKTLGVPVTDKPDDHKRPEKELIIPDDPPPTNDRFYLVLGCIFAGFWVILILACAVCYKCKHKRTEDETKYPCDLTHEIEAKNIPNGISGMNVHVHDHGLNGYIPTITSHLDEKETSFMERHNNNRVSPSQLNSSCDLSSFKSGSLERRATEMMPVSMALRREEQRNNSLQRKKKHQHISSNLGQNGSLRRGPYISCSSEDLDTDVTGDSKDSKIFPKEHYKGSRKHSRMRNSMVDG